MGAQSGTCEIMNSVSDICKSFAEKYGDKIALVDPYHDPPSTMTYKHVSFFLYLFFVLFFFLFDTHFLYLVLLFFLFDTYFLFLVLLFFFLFNLLLNG